MSLIVSVAEIGLPSVAPAEGLESESSTVSLLSTELSSVIGTYTVFVVSPAAKVTVWLTAV